MEININSVYNGDCLELMKHIKPGTIDLILTDLPYAFTENRWDSLIPFDQLWECYNRIIKNNGVIVLTASGKFTIQLINSNLKNYRYSWIWEKNNCTNFANAKHQPVRNYEDVLVFYKKLGCYNPQGLVKLDKPKDKSKDNIGESYDKPSLKTAYVQTHTGYPKSIIKFSRDKITFHPTQKPQALFEYLIKTYTNEGETVLDNCAGSGVTGLACLNTNRNYILMDTEKKYCDIMNERIKGWYEISTSTIK